MRQITEYFRNAVAANAQRTVDYRNEKFCDISLSEIQEGKIQLQKISFLWKLNKSEVDEENYRKEKSKDILIALKTVLTEFVDGIRIEEDLEEMTSILFMPAKVDGKGVLLLPEEGKMPWIPREFMEPMMEAQISIGDASTYDNFFQCTTDERNQISSWKDYLDYAQKLFESVTNSRFEENIILSGGRELKTDGKFYLIQDQIVSANFHILELYNHLLKEKNEHALYSKLTNGIEEPSKKLFKKTDISKMKKHAGQMGGEYSLSPSQREVMNHFDGTNSGDILSVSGPPGTGKTTLLQAIVADLYVKCALEEKDAPIIVAASTNNQAVTNIIDSFGKISEVWIKNLEKRWIEGVHSFATYFPSKSKITEAKNNGYQYTNLRGEFFIADIEAEENQKKSKQRFTEEFKTYFDFDFDEVDLTDCKEKLRSELKYLNLIRKRFCSRMGRIKGIIGESSYSDYCNNLELEIRRLMEKKQDNEIQIKQLQEQRDHCLRRCEEWRENYDALPRHVRWFSFIPYFRYKIVSWVYSFMNEEEVLFLKRGMLIKDIKRTYAEKIGQCDVEITDLENNKEELDRQKNESEKDKIEIEKRLNQLKIEVCKFGQYGLEQFKEETWDKFDVCEINDHMDHIRYVEFWLAVHYYESRWLMGECSITEKQKGTTFKNVLEKLYHRLAMISPCMVMTFYMLPKQFLAYDGNEKLHLYMYDYIDLLIVDEAGQISPEIAAPSFALAKKAIVVGDEHQIPPVWGTSRALDIAMAISKNVISKKEEFKRLEENGLNCSQSSLMKLASLLCPYDKYEKGLFLCEHRRCYNEIIAYCNKLVYKGKLEELRGSADQNSNVLAGYLPVMGHKQISSMTSQKIGCSRQNQEEAKQIVLWLKENYLILLSKYENSMTDKERQVDEKGVIGVITPFKRQRYLIKKLIKEYLPEWEKNISVGTVHTFQGAERKVIIFSSVYGQEEGCFFINYNKSLMNVAVSRAKDSFLIFGERRCLCSGEESASGLLKKLTMTEL